MSVFIIIPKPLIWKSSKDALAQEKDQQAIRSEAAISEAPPFTETEHTMIGKIIH